MIRTWHKEVLVVGAILAAVAYLENRPIGWLCAVAVLFTFMHAQVSFRLSEAEEQRTIIQVECYKKAQYYFLAKESCWFLYFALLGAWPALVGVLVFLLYPIWRQYHRRKTTNA